MPPNGDNTATDLVERGLALPRQADTDGARQCYVQTVHLEWLLLPAVAEYRWMQERGDTPWYARARLFRQPRPGDWETVIGRVRTDLQALLDERELTASAAAS